MAIKDSDAGNFKAKSSFKKNAKKWRQKAEHGGVRKNVNFKKKKPIAPVVIKEKDIYIDKTEVFESSTGKKKKFHSFAGKKDKYVGKNERKGIKKPYASSKSMSATEFARTRNNSHSPSVTKQKKPISPVVKKEKNISIDKTEVFEPSTGKKKFHSSAGKKDKYVGKNERKGSKKPYASNKPMSATEFDRTRNNSHSLSVTNKFSYNKGKMQETDTSGMIKNQQHNFRPKPSLVNADKEANPKTLKRKNSESDSALLPKKIKLFNLTHKERKVFRQKHDNKRFELGKRLKSLWEQVRREDCAVEKKHKLLKQMLSLIKGHVKELMFAHDTVRVIECIVALGSEAHRTMLFEELKELIVPVAKSKYAKFFLIKMLRYGTKDQKEYILKSFHGQVIKLIKHTEAATVVETAYNEYANARQRVELVQEFYGPSFAFFKNENSQSLSELLKNDPEKKTAIIKHMKESLLRAVEKNVIRHSIMHDVLREFMTHSDPSSRSEIIEGIRQSVVEILHTKDGARVGMSAVWHGTSKDRKIIIKSFKGHVTKIAKEEHGHMIFLAIFDSVDDTRLIEENIIMELMKNGLEISQDQHGRKVLLYLLCPRDSHFFHPDVLNILKQGDNNSTSKKDPLLRRDQLLQTVSEPLLKLFISNIQTFINDNAMCLLGVTILNHTSGDTTEAFHAIAKLLSKTDYFPPKEGEIHIIEHPGVTFMLKKLILDDVHNKDSKKVFFSEVLCNEVPEGSMRSWVNCNRGAFIVLSLLETGIPSAVQRVEAEMNGSYKALSEKQYAGAKLLLKKLKK